MLKQSFFFLSVTFIAVPYSTMQAVPEAEVAVAAPIQLDEARIDQAKIKMAKDFVFRSYLAKGTSIAGAATAVGLAYRWGLLDGIINLFLPAKQKQEMVPSEMANKLLDLIKRVAVLEGKIAIEPGVKKDAAISTGNYFINGVKVFGSTTLSIISTLIINAKVQHFYDYAFAKPSFEWFFMHHSVIATIDGVRRHVQVITDLNVPAEYNLEYHNRALNPALQSIARTLEEFIAFLEYYLAKADQDIVHEQAMDTLPRYLFNIGNDFFKKIEEILHGSADQSSAMALVNDFKADMTNAIHRCRGFEREFLVAD